MKNAHRKNPGLVVASSVLVLAGCRGPAPDSTEPPSSEAAPAVRVEPREPRHVTRTVPAGTTVDLELVDSIGTDRSERGDHVRARVARDVTVDGAVVIPAGSTVSGVVTEATGLKKIGGRAKLGIEFTTVDPPSAAPSDLRASYYATGKSETKKDAATIGGAAAGGALLGRIVGHQHGDDARGTAIGAVVGAGAGTAIAAKTKGEEIVLPSGHVIQVTLQGPVTVRS